jgi:hypothetical protein
LEDRTVIDTGLRLTHDVEALVKAAIVVMGLLFVLMTGLRTRSVVPTIGALLFAGLLGWGVWNTDFIQQKVDEDIRGSLGVEPVATVSVAADA